MTSSPDIDSNLGAVRLATAGGRADAHLTNPGNGSGRLARSVLDLCLVSDQIGLDRAFLLGVPSRVIFIGSSFRSKITVRTWPMNDCTSVELVRLDQVVFRQVGSCCDL